MRYDTIAAYIFAADIYCPDHIVEQLDGEAPVKNVADSVEAKLDYIADMMGIDREAEETFDSGEFPKVVLYGTIERREYCGCGHVIDGTEDLGDPDSE